MHEFEVTLVNGKKWVYADCYSFDWQKDKYEFWRGNRKFVTAISSYIVVKITMNW